MKGLFCNKKRLFYSNKTLTLHGLKTVIKYFTVLVMLSLIFISCDGFEKLVKSSDYELKLKKAQEFYGKGNYVKALQLYMELLPIFKGTDKAEEIYYYYTYCNYYQNDFSLSQYHFKDYCRQFPGGLHVEECYFMSAYCYYLSSPNYKLDQTDTKAAIKEFQAFVDEFPESKRIDTCNILIDNLRYKLENKEYELIKQYFKLGEYFNGYKAVITSAKNFMKEYPDSKFVEEMYYLVINSYYLQAINSIPSKKLERLNGGIETYLKFVDLYPKSTFLSKAESVYSSCVHVKENITNKKKDGL